MRNLEKYLEPCPHSLSSGDVCRRGYWRRSDRRQPKPSPLSFGEFPTAETGYVPRDGGVLTTLISTDPATYHNRAGFAMRVELLEQVESI